MLRPPGIGVVVSAVVAAGAMGVLSGCSVVSALPLLEWPGGDRDNPDVREAAVLDAPHPWWESFDDPVLNRVVEAVLESNYDLATAVARVEQARARARIATAARLPRVQALLGAVEFDAPTNVGLGAQLEDLGLGNDAFAAFGFSLPDRLDQATYSAGAEVAYEVDFWGRDRNAALSAGAQREASETDYRAARMGVVVQTVATYIEIVDLNRQRGFAGETVEILREWVTLAEDRYDRGIGDIRDVYALRRGLADAEASLPGVNERLADAEGRLTVVLGGQDHAGLMGTLPDKMPVSTMAPVPTGLPAEALAQRPDVAAARQRLAGARFALGARRAALLPSLSLSGSIALQSPDTAAWFDPDQWFRNLSSNLLAPVFQGGRLRADVALAEAALDEATATYGHAVVAAAAEVEAALGGLESNRQRLALVSSFAEEARAEATLQEQRYASGIGDYRTFLAASQMNVGARAARASAERDLAYARLALHRALGGAWSPNAVGMGGTHREVGEPPVFAGERAEEEAEGG
ncbi:MAG: efflux transporter outer membrane subunit [Gammaproteobacteria bacterium]|nr:efflux transporter outer membrane subunit [Gammaproteobacteria bacterium]